MGQLAQQDLGDQGQLGFGVAHRRERLRIVGGTEVALAFDQRVPVGERLRHQHQRFVAGAIAMRVVLADDVADGARGLLRLGGGVEAELAHRIDNPPLHRLEAVAQEGQGAVEHDIHRVVEVGALGVLAQGQLFETVERGTGQIGHATVLPVEGAAAEPGAQGGRLSGCGRGCQAGQGTRPLSHE